MLSRNELLEAVNALNHAYSGRQVGRIRGYRDQWFLGCSIQADEPSRKVLVVHFCQGRNTGRINFNGGYPVDLDVSCCSDQRDVFREFELLDNHKRKEKEKADARQERLEARCGHCAEYLGCLTGNCKPSQSCGYKRVCKPVKKSGRGLPKKGERHGLSKTGVS